MAATIVYWERHGAEWGLVVARAPWWAVGPLATLWWKKKLNSILWPPRDDIAHIAVWDIHLPAKAVRALRKL